MIISEKNFNRKILFQEKYYLGPQSLESGFQLDSIKDALWHKAKTTPNIFCLHTRWNRQSVASLYKQKKPFYFSILRDPVSLFISLWDYYGVSKKLNDVTLQEFAMSSNKPEKLIMPGWVSSNSNFMTQLKLLEIHLMIWYLLNVGFYRLLM